MRNHCGNCNSKGINDCERICRVRIPAGPQPDARETFFAAMARTAARWAARDAAESEEDSK